VFLEHDAADLVSQVMEAFGYLHGLDIAHRDIKPENIICNKTNDPNRFLIKIIDFGFACVAPNDQSQAFIGTLGYKAPEIFNQEPYSIRADMWALGVITFILLCGFPPFFSNPELDENSLANSPFWIFFNERTDYLISCVQAGRFSFISPFWDPISEEAKNFIQNLLVVNPHVRFSVFDAKQHNWILKNKDSKPTVQ